MEVRILGRDDFEGVYAILEESFPPDERRTKREQRTLLDDPRYGILGLCEAGEICAFLASWTLGAVVFIEHFAAKAEMRGRGLGSMLLREFVKRYSEQRICLEVEPLTDELTASRIRFYERSGFCLNPYPYVQPVMTKGRNAIPLCVMTYGAPVDRAAFCALREILYTEIYHCPIPEDDF